MHRALTIAAVTAALKRLLENGLVRWDGIASVGGDVTVSIFPPDRITVGADERPQLNLFLYQVKPNTTVRLVSNARQGAPLSFDLHYLLTVYGAQEYQLELLLGAAMQLLHQASELSGQPLDELLNGMTAAEGTAIPVVDALSRSGVLHQIERLSVVPQFLGGEELARLWSAFQARFRPSVAYKVSLALKGEQLWSA